MEEERKKEERFSKRKQAFSVFFLSVLAAMCISVICVMT